MSIQQEVALVGEKAKCKSSITRASNYLTKKEYTIENLNELLNRRKEIYRIKERFEKAQDEYEIVKPEESELHELESENFEEKYFMTLGEYDNLIENLQQSKNKRRDSTPISNDGSGIVMNHSRIPAMALPKFDGDFQ